MLFGIMAIQIKRKAPNCHTILEVVRLRWGKAAHLVRQNAHAQVDSLQSCEHCLWKYCLFQGRGASVGQYAKTSPLRSHHSVVAWEWFKLQLIADGARL